MNVFRVKQGEASGPQPWTETIGVGKSIFNFYDQQPDTTISSSTQIPSVLDGPMVVRRYKNLTVSSTLTTQYRCRGLMLLVDGNLTVTSGGWIGMGVRGARGHAGMGYYDMLIPDSIGLSSSHISKRDVLAKLRSTGYAICDRWLWDDWGKIDGVAAIGWTGGTVLVPWNGCGASMPGQALNVGIGTPNAAGITGWAGSSGGVGGGGVGAVVSVGSSSSAGSSPSGCGRPWGGGAGGSSCAAGTNGVIGPVSTSPDDFGGSGGSALTNIRNGIPSWSCGGAGNPGGQGGAAGNDGSSGTGGVVVIVCKGNITVNSGGNISANGSAGGSCASGVGGGGSGGGHVSLIYGGTYSNNGTITASGGSGGTGYYLPGGAGGAGSVVTKTFAQMGWS